MRFISSFHGAVLVLMVVFLVVRLFFYFKFKRERDSSEFDKSLWHLKFISVSFAIFIIVSLLFLPSGFYYSIEPTFASPDVVMAELIRNQKTMAQEIRQAREICYFVGFVIAAYFIAVATFIGKSQEENRKGALNQDSAFKKPLGL